MVCRILTREFVRWDPVGWETMLVVKLYRNSRSKTQKRVSAAI
jgi:hypothetical protein